MKAISLHEPWASLIASGHKTLETRSWRPPKLLVGCTIAIHAAKRRPTKEDLRVLQEIDPVPEGYQRDPAGVVSPTTTTPFGKVLCTARLVAVWQVDSEVMDGQVHGWNAAVTKDFGLSARQIGRRVKAAGLGEGFAGHSGRVGMAQDLVRNGVELLALMSAGRWKSARMPAGTRWPGITRGVEGVNPRPNSQCQGPARLWLSGM